MLRSRFWMLRAPRIGDPEGGFLTQLALFAGNEAESESPFWELAWLAGLGVVGWMEVLLATAQTQTAFFSFFFLVDASSPLTASNTPELQRPYFSFGCRVI